MPIKLVDLSFNTIGEFTKPEQALSRYKEALGYIKFLKDRVDLLFVSHINYSGVKEVDGVKYRFFKQRKNSFWYIPLKTIRYVKSIRPDVVLVQGLIFPLQVIALRMWLGRECKIVAQHHGELPFEGIKKRFQKLADSCIDEYLFTSLGNARVWVDKRIIKHIDKCAEVLEASTYFTKKDKAESKRKLGLAGEENFVWVGRLNANKDPLTVLSAFAQFAETKPSSKLYMMYHTEELFEQAKAFIEHHSSLKNTVVMIGKVSHEELEYWYSAVDFYVSASHKEGSGYALLEAMACSCIPIVTDIPSFKKITGEGKYGFLYSPGNVSELTNIFSDLHKISKKELSDKVELYFKNNLSYKNIADDIYAICEKLIAK